MFSLHIYLTINDAEYYLSCFRTKCKEDHIIYHFNLLISLNITFLKNPHSRICFTDFRKREKKRERKARHWCERETLIGCLLYVPWPGIELATFWCMGRWSNQLSHWSRAQHYIFKRNICVRICSLNLFLAAADGTPCMTTVTIHVYMPIMDI